jgi:hypothetical protein
MHFGERNDKAPEKVSLHTVSVSSLQTNSKYIQNANNEKPNPSTDLEGNKYTIRTQTIDLQLKKNPDEDVVDDDVDDVEIVRVLDTASQQSQSLGNESIKIRRVDSFKSGSQINSLY